MAHHPRRAAAAWRAGASCPVLAQVLRMSQAGHPGTSVHRNASPDSPVSSRDPRAAAGDRIPPRRTSPRSRKLRDVDREPWEIPRPERQNGVMRIIRSNPVLAVHDLELSGAWYRDVLGCELDDVEPGNWQFCRAGDTIFMLGRCPGVPPASEIGDHSYVAYLQVEDVDAFHRRATAAGADVMHPPRDEPWGMRELALRSPDGHHFTLGQAVQST